ncbi:hypothetical protein [Vibrio crassostreae]|uniref:hypothetical protein n=1 Tax=Vibrio crassostreae TaxID=246167 RepID=UPI001B315C3C|nr:hypothetical protein [Vibrio crassostreae]
MITGTYTSVWEEGTIHSNCFIDTESLQIDDIEVSDCGEEFEHLLSEHVVIVANNKEHQLEADRGELTEEAQEELAKIIN